MKTLAAAVLLCCLQAPALVSAATENASQPLAADLSRLVTAIPKGRIDTMPKQLAAQAFELIGQRKLDEASAKLNNALQLDPSNSYLQFFNAFTYHLMAQDGDTQKLPLAEQGYLLAIQFDRSNWIAHYFLGLMHFEQRNFRAAQNALAEVLLFREDDREVLFRLAAASYYAGDPVTSAACLDRLRKLHPADPQVLRLSAIISAAIGKFEDATRWLAMYEATAPEKRELARVKGRVDHWRVVHRNAPVAGNAAVPADKEAAVTTSPVSGTPLSSLLLESGERIPAPAAKSAKRGAMIKTQSMQASQSESVGDVDSTADEAKAQAEAEALEATAASERMVLVDVVIMRTEDQLSTRKGVNLLRALSLQFGGPDIPAWGKVKQGVRSREGSRTDDLLATGAIESTGKDNIAGKDTITITRGISIPALTYSLNIVNSNSNLNEVLARPTLAALEGVRSEFFSGTSLNAAVVSTGAVGGGAVQIEKEIGVKLSITPKFLPNNKVRLVVKAERTFLKPPSEDIGFTYKIEVSKIQINANVVMDLGETLVLGGLSEKETSRLRDGVPVLQDIPGVQYFFSRKDTSDFQRSVLLLITPRPTQYTYRSDASIRAEAGPNADSESIKELRARYGDWFKPYPNMASVFNHLNLSSLYREFRTGDVTLEKWDKQETTSERLQQALDFLFY